jgi:hypothetical protein
MTDIHEAIALRITELYERGLDVQDIFDRLDGRVEMQVIHDVIMEYDELTEDDESMMDDDDSAFGSAGMGCDEYYEY